MTAKDINYLLHHLFKNDDHDYLHEQMRVQIGSTLSLFADLVADSCSDSKHWPVRSKVSAKIAPKNMTIVTTPS